MRVVNVSMPSASASLMMMPLVANRAAPSSARAIPSACVLTVGAGLAMVLSVVIGVSI